MTSESYLQNTKPQSAHYLLIHESDLCTMGRTLHQFSLLRPTHMKINVNLSGTLRLGTLYECLVPLGNQHIITFLSSNWRQYSLNMLAHIFCWFLVTMKLNLFRWQPMFICVDYPHSYSSFPITLLSDPASDSNAYLEGMLSSDVFDSFPIHPCAGMFCNVCRTICFEK